MSAKNVLIIDDDIALGKMLRAGLERKGYGVVTAGSGEDGIKMLDKQAFDLLVLDIVLPKMSGIEVYKNVLQRDAKSKMKLPVLVLTSRGELEDFFDSVEVEGFANKPIDMEYFVNEASRIIEKRPLPVVFVADAILSQSAKNIKIQLKRNGYKAVFTENIETFKQTAMKNKAVCILLEYAQRTMSGKDFIKRIKEILTTIPKDVWPQASLTPVIVYTCTDGDYRDESVEAGADVYGGKLGDCSAIVSELNNVAKKIWHDMEMEALKKQAAKLGGGPSVSDLRGTFG